MTKPIKLPPLPEDWETELLDWVSACQSAYHIDNTNNHRFGGLGSDLEENRSEIICFVRGLIEIHTAAAIEAERLRVLNCIEAEFNNALSKFNEYWDGSAYAFYKAKQIVKGEN